MMKGVMNRKKYGLLILLVSLPLFLAGCLNPSLTFREVERFLGGETYDIHIVTSPLGADVEIDKHHKGVTPLRLQYDAPQYTEIFWERKQIDIWGSLYTSFIHKERASLMRQIYPDDVRGFTEPGFYGRKEYEQFINQKRVLSITKEGYEEVVIVFNMNDIETRIPEIIELVRIEAVLPSEDSEKEQNEKEFNSEI